MEQPIVYRWRDYLYYREQIWNIQVVQLLITYNKNLLTNFICFTNINIYFFLLTTNNQLKIIEATLFGHQMMPDGTNVTRGWFVQSQQLSNIERRMVWHQLTSYWTKNDSYASVPQLGTTQGIDANHIAPCMYVYVHVYGVYSMWYFYW